VSKEHVHLGIEGGVLRVTGDRPVNRSEGAKAYRSERIFGKFSRAFELPKGVEPSAISATFNHGLLEIRLPRAQKGGASPTKMGQGASTPSSDKVEQRAAPSAPSAPAVSIPKDPGLVVDIGGVAAGKGDLSGFVQEVQPPKIEQRGEEGVWSGPAFQGESLKKPLQKGLRKELDPDRPVGSPNEPETRDTSRESQV